MKSSDNPPKKNNQSLWQIIVAILLIGFPVLMLFFNGNRALRGITWGMNDEQSQVVAPSSLAVPEGTLTKPREKAPLFGVYDPESKFTGDTCFDIEQFYLSWISIDEKSVSTRLENIVLNNRIPFITIEPWNGSGGEMTLMQDILSGVYDTNIQDVINSLNGIKGKIYLSWGHEMDQDITKRYPWSGSDPALYINAYRYFADKLDKNLSSEIIWIWSPVGKKGCEKYWPGDNYADLVGFPIYSYPAWDRSYYGNIRSFKTWYDEKFKLVEQFNKPVMIVEMGVTGSQDYQVYWLQEAFNTIKSIPAIEAVVFFQKKDTPGSWGENIETPDWRTDPEIITGFVTWMKSEY